VNKAGARQAQVVRGALGDRPEKVPMTARLLLRESLIARRAAGIIAAFTVLITVAGGILERLVDHHEFPTIGRGVWFALQTVTTVGYGDLTPRQPRRPVDRRGRDAGRDRVPCRDHSLGDTSLVESSRRRFAAQSEQDATRQLAQVSERLARIEAAIERSGPPGKPDGVT
jgi:voltage-gated potassium channel